VIDPPKSVANEIVLGHSVGGAPIVMKLFGESLGQGTPVLVLGAIHGNETTTAHLTARLAEELPRNGEVLAGKTVAIIPIANPDGYAADTRTNAHGVDLNRNFPASNYRSTQRYGPQPDSEPETHAILAALDQVKPRLIISIHSIDKNRQCNNYDGPAEDIAKAMSACNGYPITANIGYPTPGSMGSYCGIDRQIPMITLELPRDLPADDAWQQNREALLAAIRAAR
jgi:protein MpaA